MFILFCRFMFWWRRWSFDGRLPEIDQYIILVGPHTSNWDFIYGVAARDKLKTDIKFIGKKELFKFPFKKFFLRMGGYPVNRHKNENAVDMVVRLFRENPRFILSLSPEGTRSKVDDLKSGFFYISREAAVPCVMVGIDYAKRKFVINTPYYPSEKKSLELERVRLFYSGITGKNPQLGIDQDNNTITQN